MIEPSRPGTRHPNPGQSGAAALCTFAAAHGVALTPRELGALLAPLPLELGLVELLVAARYLGFEATPLEGEIHHLPEVERPNLVSLDSTDSEGCWVVLYDIDEAKVTLAHPADGVVTIPLGDFAVRWTGDCLFLAASPSTLEALRARLTDLRDPIVRLRNALGLRPPWGRGLLFLAALLLVGLVCLGGGLLGLGLALATAAALWRVLLGGTCRSCSAAAVLIGGLPLELAGVVLYGGLLIAARTGLTGIVMTAVLGLAVGIHLDLLRRLAGARLACRVCLLAAGAAGLALAGALWAAPTAWALAGIAVGLLSSWVILDRARVRFERQRDEATEALAASVLAEPAAAGPLAVVYKRSGCARCALYEAVVRPSLAENFGEVLQVEEREAKPGVRVPLMIVRGSRSAVLPADDYAAVEAAVEAAIQPLEADGL